MSHIVGKVYDLTQENFNKIIAELETYKAALNTQNILNKSAFDELAAEKAKSEKLANALTNLIKDCSLAQFLVDEQIIELSEKAIAEYKGGK